MSDESVKTKTSTENSKILLPQGNVDEVGRTIQALIGRTDQIGISINQISVSLKAIEMALMDKGILSEEELKFYMEKSHKLYTIELYNMMVKAQLQNPNMIIPPDLKTNAQKYREELGIDEPKKTSNEGVSTEDNCKIIQLDKEGTSKEV